LARLESSGRVTGCILETVATPLLPHLNLGEGREGGTRLLLDIFIVILMVILMKTCSKCKESKDLSQFDKNKAKASGLHSACKACRKEQRKAYYDNNKEAHHSRTKRWAENNREAWNNLFKKAYRKNPSHYIRKAATRRSYQISATPPWSEKELIEKVYLKASDYGAHVDHIVPLKSDVVCGLHVWANLQLLPPTDNISKGNRSWPDSWE
jgi:hypothetical protein